jgi:hypothetical protein
MDDWIRAGARLLGEPVIVRMAATLADRARARHERVPPFETLLATCVGAVVIVWITLTPLADEKDVISGSVPDIDKLAGIEGFCNLLTDEWLVVLDADHIKLSGFSAHGLVTSKRREQDAARARRYRNRKKRALASRIQRDGVRDLP